MINTVTGTVLGGCAGAYCAGTQVAAQAAQIVYLENLAYATAAENTALRALLTSAYSRKEVAQKVAKIPLGQDFLPLFKKAREFFSVRLSDAGNRKLSNQSSYLYMY